MRRPSGSVTPADGETEPVRIGSLKGSHGRLDGPCRRRGQMRVPAHAAGAATGNQAGDVGIGGDGRERRRRRQFRGRPARASPPFLRNDGAIATPPGPHNSTPVPARPDRISTINLDEALMAAGRSAAVPFRNGIPGRQPRAAVPRSGSLRDPRRRQLPRCLSRSCASSAARRDFRPCGRRCGSARPAGRNRRAGR